MDTSDDRSPQPTFSQTTEATSSQEVDLLMTQADPRHRGNNDNPDVLEDYDIVLSQEAATLSSLSADTEYRNAAESSKVNGVKVKEQASAAAAPLAHHTPPAAAVVVVDRVPPLLPHVNCPEKIFICLDLDEEMDTTQFSSRAGEKYSSLDVAKRAMKMFVMHKNSQSPEHEFSLLVCHDEAAMIRRMTKRSKDVLNSLDNCRSTMASPESLNVSQLFETIQENVDIPSLPDNPAVEAPPYIVRLILVYGRSHSVPVEFKSQVQRELESSPYFFTDVLYIHEPASDDNKCEEIFQSLCSLDHSGLSHIYDVSRYTHILNASAKLLAHPLQRCPQLQGQYKIGESPAAAVGAGVAGVASTAAAAASSSSGAVPTPPPPRIPVPS